MLIWSALAGVAMGTIAGCILSVLPFVVVVISSLICLTCVLAFDGASFAQMGAMTGMLLVTFQIGYVIGLVVRSLVPSRAGRRGLSGNEAAPPRRQEHGRGTVVVSNGGDRPATLS